MEESKNFVWANSPSNSSDTRQNKPAAAPKPGRIAPPPLEVKIRTLKSDLELLAQGGGFVAQGGGQRVSVSLQSETQKNKSNRNFLKWLLVVVVIAGLIGFGLFGYYVFYPLIFGKNNSSLQNKKISNIQSKFSNSNQESTSSLLKENQNFVPEQLSTNFIHQSFFRKDVDEVLTLVVKKGPAISATELQTYGQKLFNLVSSINSTSTFFEILIKLDNQPMAAAKFSELVGSIIDVNFLNENFYPDFTAFVYKDENGFWPGYIFKLLPGKNWLFLKDHPAIINIEKSSKLNLLFLAPPGSENPRGFEDIVILNQSFRALSYKNPAAKFIYGWVVGGYFILSTSENSLKEALIRLY